MAEDLMGKVISLFSSGDDPKDDLSHMLKQAAKDLQGNKFAKFFRMKTEEVDPSFFSFLFSIYRLVYPIKVFMDDKKKTTLLRKVIIEAFMDRATLEISKRLDLDVLEKMAKTTPPMELVQQIKADFEKLVSQFDIDRINAADRCYSLVAALEQLVSFNFFGLFKKVDPQYVDASFAVEPKFLPVKVVNIIQELGDFLSVTQSLKPEDDWNNLLNLLKICAGQELAAPDVFINEIKNLREIHSSRILLLMVQYSGKNPLWYFKTKTPDEHIGETWLEERRAELGAYIDQIINAQKTDHIHALIKEIFENPDLVRLENYTVNYGNACQKRGLEGFTYAEGLNYLSAFLRDYLNREIKDLCDILLVRGRWNNNAMYKEMSEAMFQLLEVPASIDEIDRIMSEDGADGSRLRAAIMRMDRDRTQVRYINGIISKNNEWALEVINKAAQDFIIIGKYLKSLIDDVQKKHPEKLMNWRELNSFSKDPLQERMVNSYKRINYFVQLMRLCTQ